MAEQRQRTRWVLAGFALILAGLSAGVNCQGPGDTQQRAARDGQDSKSPVRGAAHAAEAGAEEQAAAPGRYMALILTVEQYDDFVELHHPHKSGEALGNALSKVGFQVTRLRDRQVTRDAVKKWLANVKAQRADLAFIAISGHGVLRSGKEVFMTADAIETKGGISLEEIGKQVESDGLPVIGLYDCCRSGAREESFKAPAGAPAGEVRGPVSTHGRTGMIWLHATQRHEVVFDSRQDLLASLAEGLAVDARSKRFRAMSAQSLFSHSANLDTEDLTVLEWFIYAVFKVSAAQRLKQSPNLEGHGDELSKLVVAHIDPLGPGPKLRRRVSSTSGEDLLRVFRPHHGSYQWQPLLGGVGLRINRNRADNPEPWLAGYVAHSEQGLSTTGKAMFVELAARTNPLGPVAVEKVAIGIDAKYVDPPRHDTWVNAGGEKAHLVLPVNRMVWCRVDLDQDQRLNYIGWSDLPAGVSLDVRRVRLADRNLENPGEAASGELLESWWVSNTGRGDDETALTWSTETLGGRRVLRIGSGTGWIGGLVAPERFVSQGDVVEVEIENLSRQEAGVVFELKSGRTPIGSARFRLPPGRSTHSVTVERDSVLDFMALHGPTEPIRVLRVTLQAGEVEILRER